MSTPDGPARRRPSLAAAVAPARPADAPAWLRMRRALWPSLEPPRGGGDSGDDACDGERDDGPGDEHAVEVARFFRGPRTNPLEVLIAWPAPGPAAGASEVGGSGGGVAEAGALESGALESGAGDPAPLGFLELSIRAFVDGCVTDRVAYVEGWWVEPDARGRAVGRALVEAAETWGRAQGCRELASDAELDNAASQAAHARLGFEESGRVVLYRKDL